MNRDNSHSVFDRIISDSQLIVGDNFEAALEDIIDLLEHPPTGNDVAIPSVQLPYRIAKTLKEGLAGLPPSGFEFCLWLWDAAPLHAVSVGEIHDVETVNGFKFGVIHLRKIASLVVGYYLARQPKRIAAVIELMDSSVSWVDARNLVNHALLGHFRIHFNEEKKIMLQLAAGTNLKRKLVPLGIAAWLIADEHISTGDGLDFVRLALPDLGNELIYRAVGFVLRVGGMYGDLRAVLEFLASSELTARPECTAIVHEFLRNPKLKWETISAPQMTRLMSNWRERGVRIDQKQKESIDRRLLSGTAA